MDNLDSFFALFACFYLCALCEEQIIPRKGRKGFSRKARKDVISTERKLPPPPVNSPGDGILRKEIPSSCLKERQLLFGTTTTPVWR